MQAAVGALMYRYSYFLILHDTDKVTRFFQSDKKRISAL
jgi:hypothetical protein